jgi:glucose/arabinose dehydrogenase
MTPLSIIRIKKSACIFILLVAINLSNFASAQPTLGFNLIAQGLTSPVDIKNAGDSSNRLFIVEQSGTIRIYKNGSLLTKPFLDVSSLVRYREGEQGLLSLAFHPNYKNNGYFFIYYTATNENVTLARYRVSATNPDVANPSSGVILFSYPKPGGFGNHNGGNISFGRDGDLYISIGDGGSEGDPFNNAQNGQSYFGKMLRIAVNTHKSPPYYTIPPNNPFVNNPNVLDEIWHLGLRNPWRWSFDRGTGDMWIGDVGQDSLEEIDYRRSTNSGGNNFGWRCYEANKIYDPDSCQAKKNYTFPIFQYHHDISTGGECVIGGYVYRGTSFPSLQGYYVCADYISANAWKIKSNGTGGWNVFLQQNVPSSIVSFGEDESGELYTSTRTGNVYHVVAVTNFVESTDKIQSITNASFVFPTLIDNKTVNVQLDNGSYRLLRVVDMHGRIIMQKDITGRSGKISLHLENVNPGMYIVQLTGTKVLQQKIYITK